MWLSVVPLWCACGQLRGVTLERNKNDYGLGYFKDGRIVVDGVEWKE